MSTVDSEVERLYALAVERARGARARPTMLEALWDGDSGGWMLKLFLTIRVLFIHHKRFHLATLRYGSDIRLFSGSVPPWPESEVAQKLGEQLEQEFGCRLWFPSPNQPDDHTPAYAERGRAIACADCSKLVIPSDSPYLPNHICYHCHLDRQQRASLLREPSQDISGRGFCVVIEGDSPPRHRQSGGSLDDSPLARLLALADPAHPPISDHRLEAQAVVAFAEAAAQEVERLLEVHRPAPEDRGPRLREFEWRGRTVQLDLHLDPRHFTLAKAISLAKFGEEARASGRALEVFTNIGIKHRDGHLLGQLGKQGGAATRAEFHQLDAVSFGSVEAVDAAIARLEAVGCVRRDGDVIHITRKGELIGNNPEERG